MRSASPALIAYLNSGSQFLMADLYTLTLTGGFVVRYTNADVDLTCDGRLFKKFMIARTNTKTTVGLEVDTLDVTVNPALADLLNGASWLAAARNGALDGANLSLERIFMPTWGDTSLGSIILFQGRVSALELGRTAAKFTVKSELELLDTQLPRNFYQSTCLNTLFDGACGVDKESRGITGIVVGGVALTQMTGSIDQATDFFSLGTVKFTSGVNAGVTRSIRYFADRTFVFGLPLVTAPAPGDSFRAYPGCDKLLDTCKGKFGNVIRFRGYPFVPDPETAT